MSVVKAQPLLQEDFNDTGYQASWRVTDKVERALWLGVSGSSYLRFHPRYAGQYIQAPVLYQPAGTYRLSFAWNRARADAADSVQVQLFDAGAWQTIHTIGSGNDRRWQTDTVSFSTAQDSFSLRWRYFSPGRFPAQYVNLDEVLVEKAVATAVPADQRDVTMMILPNPAPGYFQLLVDNPRLRSGIVEIYSPAGSRVFVTELPAQQRVQIPVDLSGLSKGAYFLSIRTSSYIVSQKLLIQ